jgi:hypothetical protein
MSSQNAVVSAQEVEVTTPVLTLVPIDTKTEAEIVRRLTECSDCE